MNPAEGAVEGADLSLWSQCSTCWCPLVTTAVFTDTGVSVVLDCIIFRRVSVILTHLMSANR